MTEIKVCPLFLRLLTATALIVGGLSGVAIWALWPDPLPALLQGLASSRYPAIRQEEMLTDRIRQSFKPGTAEATVVENLKAQGFKSFGSAETGSHHFLFERYAFPCKERFLVDALFDEGRLRDVQGYYQTVCL